MQRLLPLIQGLAGRGCPVHALVDPRFADDVVGAGARFVDLFAEGPLDEIDNQSVPVPSRYVTFAAVRTPAITKRLAALRPRLIVYDTFSVVAPLVARRLGVPAVNVCCGHAMVPAGTLADLARDPRVNTSAACLGAVSRLREEHGLVDASPFSYVSGLSPHLNVYGEPPQFLTAEERAAFEPILFFGSLAPTLREGRRSAPVFRSPGGLRRIYVSFGSVVWKYFQSEAEAALRAVASAVLKLDADVVVTLAGHALTPATRSTLAGAGIRVERWVDQWSVLQEADLFLTHHGLNSTHEAIYHRVPMLSYPFFTDQPALARRCQQLGLAVALAPAPRARLPAGGIEAAIQRLDDDRAGFAARLEEARRWELETIKGRDLVLDRICALG